MRVAACVITYHPDSATLLQNIAAFIDDVETVIIYLNSSEELTFPEEYLSKIIFMGSGENHYMAQALNECIEYCHHHGYDYLLTMDQDSLWEDFKGFLSKVQTIESSDVVIYAPNVNHALPEATPHEIESTITSGSLHRVELVKSLGSFKEYYKIYWVDGEFCHRARQNGYKIMALPQYNLQQRFGQDKKTRWGGYFCADYSPETYYFLFRNMILMRRECKNTPSIRCMAYTSFLYLRSILLGEENKGLKLHRITQGIIDGYANIRH